MDIKTDAHKTLMRNRPLIFLDLESTGLEVQKQEIIDGVLQTQKSLGIDLNQLSKDERWVYAHLNGKNPFLTQNAAGLYRKGDGYVSVSLGGTEGFDSIVKGEKVRQKITII